MRSASAFFSARIPSALLFSEAIRSVLAFSEISLSSSCLALILDAIRSTSSLSALFLSLILFWRAMRFCSSFSWACAAFCLSCSSFALDSSGPPNPKGVDGFVFSVVYIESLSSV